MLRRSGFAGRTAPRAGLAPLLTRPGFNRQGCIKNGDGGPPPEGTKNRRKWRPSVLASRSCAALDAALAAPRFRPCPSLTVHIFWLSVGLLTPASLRPRRAHTTGCSRGRIAHLRGRAGANGESVCQGMFGIIRKKRSSPSSVPAAAQSPCPAGITLHLRLNIEEDSTGSTRESAAPTRPI